MRCLRVDYHLPDLCMFAMSDWYFSSFAAACEFLCLSVSTSTRSCRTAAGVDGAASSCRYKARHGSDPEHETHIRRRLGLRLRLVVAACGQDHFQSVQGGRGQEERGLPQTRQFKVQPTSRGRRHRTRPVCCRAKNQRVFFTTLRDDPQASARSSSGSIAPARDPARNNSRRAPPPPTHLLLLAVVPRGCPIENLRQRPSLLKGDGVLLLRGGSSPAHRRLLRGGGGGCSGCSGRG